jgi:hypothetical protein
MNRTSYGELSSLINRTASSLQDPSQYAGTLVKGRFESQSGAAKFAFVPFDMGFRDYEGRAIVALSGDRAPFATGGLRLDRLPGYKIVSVDLDRGFTEPFIHNTEGKPASRLSTGGTLLERPIDIKFGPDVKMYILANGNARRARKDHPRNRKTFRPPTRTGGEVNQTWGGEDLFEHVKSSVVVLVLSSHTD